MSQYFGFGADFTQKIAAAIASGNLNHNAAGTVFMTSKPLAVPSGTLFATPTQDQAAAAAAQAKATADAATLAALRAQQAQAEADANVAITYAQETAPPPTLFEKFGPWLWVGAAAGAVVMIVVGYKLTHKNPSVGGYRRRKRSRR